ncbi:hypothetical protein L6164_008788 [Bauhinia variegata]|uniref:Uncharacterized protein n=1 Tax=Bauhinia variegata TaxID=167791 RepID=A0ACB9PGZ7_BAUVA|nr:hypothetical protein L6164_008788 [Bauhinia variegata]
MKEYLRYIFLLTFFFPHPIISIHTLFRNQISINTPTIPTSSPIFYNPLLNQLFSLPTIPVCNHNFLPAPQQFPFTPPLHFLHPFPYSSLFSPSQFLFTPNSLLGPTAFCSHP